MLVLLPCCRSGTNNSAMFRRVTACCPCGLVFMHVLHVTPSSSSVLTCDPCACAVRWSRSSCAPRCMPLTAPLRAQWAPLPLPLSVRVTSSCFLQPEFPRLSFWCRPSHPCWRGVPREGLGFQILRVCSAGAAGLVAERVFGFQGSLADHGVPDPALQLANARALGNSLLILLLVPWGLDFLFYCGACWHLGGPHCTALTLESSLCVPSSRALKVCVVS